jgi:hypothetical protein
MLGKCCKCGIEGCEGEDLMPTDFDSEGNPIDYCCEECASE